MTPSRARGPGSSGRTRPARSGGQSQRARAGGSGPRSSSAPRSGASRTGSSARSKSATGASAGRGSAAQPPLPGWLGRFTGGRTNRRTVRRIAIGCTLLFLVILVAPTLRAYVEQRSDIAALRDKVAQQEREVKALQDEQARWEDPAYVEQQARTRLKFVKVGEKSYTVLEPKEAATTPERVAGAGPSTDPWYLQMASSMQAADVPANQRR